VNHDDYRRTRDMILERVCIKGDFKRNEDDIIAGIEMPDISNLATTKLRNTVHADVIQSLSYLSMTNR